MVRSTRSRWRVLRTSTARCMRGTGGGAGLKMSVCCCGCRTRLRRRQRQRLPLHLRVADAYLAAALLEEAEL